MGGFTNVLIVIFVIQLTLISFGYANIPGDALYNFLTNPYNWEGSQWDLLMSDVFLAMGAVTAIIGLYFIKSDFIVFAGFAGVLFSFGKGLGNLHQIMSSSTSPVIANFVVGPIILLYIFGLITWWRTSR